MVVALTFLAAGTAQAQETFVIPIAEDTLLYVDNRGATRILVDLNGTAFKLAADPAEAAASPNGYLIPRVGAVTLDISAYMGPGENANVIAFTPQGPPGSGFDFVLAPVFVEGQTAVTYTLSGLGSLPESFAMRAGPNPGRGPVTVSFSVPAARVAGVPVRLTVTDAQGRLVAVLVEGVRFPGAFRAVWPANVAAGVYRIRFETDTGAETMAVTRVR